MGLCALMDCTGVYRECNLSISTPSGAVVAAIAVDYNRGWDLHVQHQVANWIMVLTCVGSSPLLN